MADDRDFSKYQCIIVTTVLKEAPEPSILAVGGVYFKETALRLQAYTEILNLKQIEKPFFDTVLEGLQVAQNPEFHLQRSGNEVYFLVDQSEAASDFYTQIPGDLEVGIIPCEMTTGKLDEEGMVAEIPFRDVVATLADAYQGARIQIAKGLELTDALSTLLPNVRVKVADEAGAVEIAVGLVVWQASRGEVEVGGGDEYDTGDDLSGWGLPG
jgi:hypothetical protein